MSKKSMNPGLDPAEVADAFESLHGSTGVTASWDNDLVSWVVWEPEEGEYWLVNEAGDGSAASANGLSFCRAGEA